jgi:hypothetical protein
METRKKKAVDEVVYSNRRDAESGIYQFASCLFQCFGKPGQKRSGRDSVAKRNTNDEIDNIEINERVAVGIAKEMGR